MTELVIAVLSLACCVYFASATAKLRGRSAYHSFQAGLADTGLTSRRLLPGTAALLVAGETLLAAVAAAAVLLTAAGAAGATTVTDCALGLGAVLTSILATGIAVILHRGTRARCACFGSVTNSTLGRPHLVRNLGLLALLVVALISAQYSHGQPSAGGALVAVIAGAVTGLMLIRFDDVVALFAPISSGSPR